MGWVSSDGKHEGATAYVLDSLDSDPVAYGSDVIESEGFRVVAWCAICTCGWTGPTIVRLIAESLSASEGYSSDGFAPPYVQGFCEGTWTMHTNGIYAGSDGVTP